MTVQDTLLDKNTNVPFKIIEGKNGSINKFYYSDCMTGIKNNLQKNSVDVVVTSPPYNIGVDYEIYKDNLPRKEYLSWLKQLGLEIKRVLKNNGSYFLNIGNKPKDQWIAWDVAHMLRDEFVLQNVIHWVKSIAISKANSGSCQDITNDMTIGHFKPIVSNRFLNDCHEYIFHFTKEGNTELDKLSVGVPYQDKSNVRRWKSAKLQDKRDRGNTWFIPYNTIKSRNDRPHPASFPPKLPEMCIRLHGLKEDLVVMDPFMGIGSTALASIILGVSFIGFEINKAYIDETILRLKSNGF